MQLARNMPTLDASVFFITLKLDRLTFPVPPPLPMPMLAGFEAPKLNEINSISPSCPAR
jgi:hypothetical protein